MRIGSVPYLNGKPLVDWFHSGEAPASADVVYAVPSQLASLLRAGEIDVANCSIFEGLLQPGLRLVPNISISADGPVKSVRLFSKVTISTIRSVALDTSSLTSAALTRILLAEMHGIAPAYCHHAPDLDAMLQNFDAGLIIGDLKLFDLQPGTVVLDLGEAWKELTGLPFVYAGWLAREERASEEMAVLLTQAKQWGVARLEELAVKWSSRLGFSLEQCRDYFLNVMDYDLTPNHLVALDRFRRKCFEHGLIETEFPLPLIGA